MSTPTVMVSSTFYDLRQIRNDLADFIISGLGYSTLLSEFPSFPIDPDINTIENCRKRVDKNADILVLIIGGRYGTIDKKTEKSITNLEYLTAKRKGIPIYVFIDKQVLSVLHVWKNNLEGDYSNIVDTTSLFEFIEEIRSKEGVWTFPFETAQEIVTTLKIQLAHLFYDSLQMRKQFVGTGLPTFFRDLSPKALRIALEKPEAWEYLLFLQVWLDETERHNEIIREYEEGLKIGFSELVSVDAAISWFQTRLSEFEGYIDSANHLIEVSVQNAFGEQGQLGDPVAIIWNAKKLSDVLEATVKWALRLRRAYVTEPFTDVSIQMSKFPDYVIERMQHFPKECISTIEKSLLEVSSEETKTLTLTITFEISNMDGYNSAIAEAKKRYSSGKY